MTYQQKYVIWLVAIVSVLGSAVVTEVVIKNKHYWTDEPYEPTIQITTKNGVQDTTYGYKIYKIIEK